MGTPNSFAKTSFKPKNWFLIFFWWWFLVTLASMYLLRWNLELYQGTLNRRTHRRDGLYYRWCQSQMHYSLFFYIYRYFFFYQVCGVLPRKGASSNISGNAFKRNWIILRKQMRQSGCFNMYLGGTQEDFRWLSHCFTFIKHWKRRLLGRSSSLLSLSTHRMLHMLIWKSCTRSIYALNLQWQFYTIRAE